MRGIAALATVVGLMLVPALAGRVEAQQPEMPPGATALMRYWTDKGTLWVSCVHPSCFEGSTVSMRRVDARPVPSLAAFQAEQLNLAGTERAVAFAKPAVRKSRGATAMILRGRAEESGRPTTFITRGMIYYRDCAVSVVSTSSNKVRADAMFDYGYGVCKNR